MKESQNKTTFKEKFKNFFVKMWQSIKTTCKEVFCDWRTAIVFVVVFLVMSSEVWVPYLISFITPNEAIKATMISVGSACWLFWLGPGTPFLPLCVAITFAIKKTWAVVAKKKKAKLNTEDIENGERKK